MRYLISVVHEGALPKDVPAELYEAMGKYVSKLTEDGVLLDGAGLAAIEEAKRVDLRDGRVTIVDGPFPETKEWVGGYFLVKVASEADAIGVARNSAELHRKHFPGFDVTHEVRQIMEG